MQELRFREKLDQYIQAGFPLIYIKSFEEGMVDKTIESLHAKENMEIYEWSEANGFYDIEEKEYHRGKTLVQQLDNFLTNYEINKKIFVIKDAHICLKDYKVVSKIKKLAFDICQKKKKGKRIDGTIIFLSPVIFIPKEIENYIQYLEPDPLNNNEIKIIIEDYLKEKNETIADSLMEKMTNSFKGISEYEIRKIMDLNYSYKGEITVQVLNIINEQKKQIIFKSGILEMIVVKEEKDDIGGLKELINWLQKKAKIINDLEKAKKFGVDPPKGVLIAGMPGCGKSLTAKLTSKIFGNIPLLRLDIGRIMGKYVGESEENLRRALGLAEAISPCVLWIDELEKAFAGSESNNGSEVTKRLLGMMLTWLQDKETMVFVVATANNIEGNLPPELLRKGRFDEIFYVPLPNYEERKEIFEVQIKKRKEEFWGNIKNDIDEICENTKGYCGADIEGVVKVGFELAFISGCDVLKTEHINTAIKQTSSLTEIMSCKVENMMKYYEDNCFRCASKK